VITDRAMKYEFLVESYASERLKLLSIWSEFRDDDLPVRPSQPDPRGRSVHEHMVHQCVSEDLWFRNMLGIDVGAPPLPHQETRIEFIRRYAEDSGNRLAALQRTDDLWWEQSTTFFDVSRSRAWVMTRRLTHTSHHRGQQMAMLRMMGRDLHSNYGPTADTGGLMQNHAPTVWKEPGDAGGEHIALSGRLSRRSQGCAVRFDDGKYFSRIRRHGLHRQGCIQSPAHSVELLKPTLKFRNGSRVVRRSRRKYYDLYLYLTHVRILGQLALANHYGAHERDCDPDA
jgi:uncharacterized damage-inducible protein DinB